MNYIKHLTGFFDKVLPDDRLNATHISLYLALFQYWNVNRFKNPVSITRNDVMLLSKISSNATYHKCMRDLHNFGYIVYIPSYNPFKGSLIHLIIFDPDHESVQNLDSDQAKNYTGTGQGIKQALVPSINNSKHIKQIINSDEKFKNSDDGKDSMPLQLSKGNDQEKTKKKKNEELPSGNPTQNGSGAKEIVFRDSERNPDKISKKASSQKAHTPADLNEVLEYFRTENYPELEARKFYNHFQSNGWKVGGKAPMKDWHAAANNWMLNKQNFSPSHFSPGTVHLNNTKNYSEPL